MKIKSMVLFVGALLAAAVLRAGVVDGLSSGPVVPGEWNSNFSACKSYAEANGYPMLVFWSSPGCAKCNKMVTAVNSSTFVAWRQARRIVLAFSEGDSTVKSFTKNSSGEYPYMRIYWPAGNVDYRFSGRSSTIPASGTTLADQLINLLDSYLGAWDGKGKAVSPTPAPVTPSQTTTGGKDSVKPSPAPVTPSQTTYMSLWSKARTILGIYETDEFSPAGVVTVKCGKANKSGVASVSMTIKKFDGKTINCGTIKLNLASNKCGDAGWCVEFKNGYSLSLDDDGFGGLDFSGTGVGDDSYGSGLPIGGAINSAYYYDFFVDASYSEVCDAISEKVPGGFALGEQVVRPLWLYDYDDVGGPMSFSVVGNKFDFGKPVTPKFTTKLGDTLNYNDDDDLNLAGVRLSYNPKTGIFKGSFNIYGDARCCMDYPETTRSKPQLKKFSVAVNGVFINFRDGILTEERGGGIAVCKKLGLVMPVFVEISY